MWMIIVRGEAPQGSEIAGVFKEHRDALAYSSELNASWSFPQLELHEIPAEDYPVLFIDDFSAKDQIYVTCEELADKLFHLEKIKDEDHQYFILTVFRKDYRGYEEGAEYIKMKEHYHIDNVKIIHLLEIGLSTPNGRINGYYQCSNCGKTAKSALAENGYSPPLGWEIALVDHSYQAFCSAKCFQEATDKF